MQECKKGFPFQEGDWVWCTNENKVGYDEICKVIDVDASKLDAFQILTEDGDTDWVNAGDIELYGGDE